MAVDDLGDDVSQIGHRLNVVELGRFDERCHGRTVLGSGVGAGEECVLTIKSNRPDQTLDCIGVDLDTAVIYESGPDARRCDRPSPRVSSGQDRSPDAYRFAPACRAENDRHISTLAPDRPWPRSAFDPRRLDGELLADLFTNSMQEAMAAAGAVMVLDVDDHIHLREASSTRSAIFPQTQLPS